MHSLAQELTMVTEFTTIEAAEDRIEEMRAEVEKGADPEIVLMDEGITPRPAWIDELTGL